MGIDCYDGIDSIVLPPLLFLAEARGNVRTTRSGKLQATTTKSLVHDSLCLLAVKFEQERKGREKRCRHVGDRTSDIGDR